MIHTRYFRISIFFIGITLGVIFSGAYMAAADTVTKIQDGISAKNNEIKKIEEDIARFERELVSTEAQAESLQGTISQLNLTQRKLGADVSLTQTKIDTTNLTIEQLIFEINNTEEGIESNLAAMISTLQHVNVAESSSLVEMMLSTNNLSDFWNDIENLSEFRNSFKINLDRLSMLKTDLLNKRNTESIQRDELVSLQSKFVDQKKIVDSNKRNKSILLDDTKDREATYKRVLAEKRAAKVEFEDQLRDFEAQLKYALDTSKLPTKGSGVLKWPLPDLSLDTCYQEGQLAINCITQYFGNTKFAQSGAYSGSGHNGADFRSVSGTEVYASASGVIQAVGNTDAYPGCYSYGKWVLVRHDNGLTTLSAHLSLIKTKKGDRVSAGDVIGYSGNTGYSTGPHLHFTVYASDAVQIVRLGDRKTRTNCADAHIPIAPYSAYLNPIDYLKD